MTRTTPSRRITLHLSQIFFTDARTFIRTSGAGGQGPGKTPRLGACPYSFRIILPRVGS